MPNAIKDCISTAGKQNMCNRLWKGWGSLFASSTASLLRGTCMKYARNYKGCIIIIATPLLRGSIWENTSPQNHSRDGLKIHRTKTEGDYRLFLYMVRTWNACLVRICLNGNALPDLLVIVRCRIFALKCSEVVKVPVLAWNGKRAKWRESAKHFLETRNANKPSQL